MLAISRAFGNYELKKWVIANPYVTETLISTEDTQLILACDGLWDVCGDQEAVDCIKGDTDAAIASEKLVNLAIGKGSKDNVSVMVVIL